MLECTGHPVFCVISRESMQFFRLMVVTDKTAETARGGLSVAQSPVGLLPFQTACGILHRVKHIRVCRRKA